MVWYLPQNSNLTWHDSANCRLKRGRWGYIKTYTFIEKWIHFISDAGSGWRLFPKDAQTYSFLCYPKAPLLPAVLLPQTGTLLASVHHMKEKVPVSVLHDFCLFIGWIYECRSEGRTVACSTEFLRKMTIQKFTSKPIKMICLNS